MNLQINFKVKTWMISMPLLLLSVTVRAGITEENPGQYAAMTGWSAQIGETVSDQTADNAKSAALKGAIAAEYTTMKKWEQKYSEYLQHIDSLTSNVKSCMMLYGEGVKALLNLTELQKAVRNNPKGIVSSAFLSSVYLHTAITAVKTYSTLKKVVSKGGPENMLNGAERTLLLQQLNEDMEEMNKDIRQLTLAVAFYTFEDLWNYYTAGMFDRHADEVAAQAYKRWQRSYRVAYIYSHH